MPDRRDPVILPEPTRHPHVAAVAAPADALPFTVEHLFLREADPTWRVEPHQHPHVHQWYACVHGALGVRADGQALPLNPEQSVLVLPGRERAVQSRRRASGYLVALFRWHGAPLDALCHRVLDLSPGLGADFFALADELKTGGGDDAPVLRRVLLARLLLGLSRSAGAAVAVKGLNAADHRDVAGKAETYMRANLDRTLPRAEIARAVHLSESHLARVFRAATGRSVNDRLTELRLERAKDLLMSSRWSVTRIATEVGFSSFSHFSRLFHRRVGMAPSDYRRSQNRVYQ